MLSAKALQMQVAIDSNKTNIRVIFKNMSDRAFLLGLGNIVGRACYPHVQLKLDGNCTEKGLLIDRTNASGAISGRGDSWVVIMPALATYSIGFATDKLFLQNSRKVIDVLTHGCTVTTYFVGSIGFDTAPGGRKIPFSITRNGPTQIPFWVGSVEATGEY
jgi:hypothetical protein